MKYFISTGGDITLGLRTHNTSANWIAGDNFTLTYYGKYDGDPAKIVLDDYISGVKNEYGDASSFKANITVKETYKAALAAAEAATDNYDEKKTTLEAAVEALVSSIEDYRKLNNALSSIQKYINKSREEWSDLAEELETLYNTMQAKYDNETASEEEVTAFPENIHNICVSYISNALSTNPKGCVGKDVTLLLMNPSFDAEFSGWTVNNGDIVWGGENVGPLPENHPAYPYTVDGIVDGGCAEKWHEAFDICQTIKNMPSGVFQLSCQAFERDDAGDGIQAELYAFIGKSSSAQTVKVMDINEDAQEEELYDPEYGGGHNEPGTNNADKYNSDGKWIPNGMSSSNVYFRAGLYKNYFDIVVNTPSDIKLGIRTTSDGDWVLFDDFKLVYRGIEVDTVSLNSLMSSIQNLYDVTDYIELNEGAHAALGTALSKAKAQVSTAVSKEDCETIINELKTAGIRYVKDALPKGDAKFDITFMLTNPDLSDKEAWKKADGWYTDQTDGNSQVMVNDWATSEDGIHDKFYEYWSEIAKDNNLFTVYQQATLPIGKYEFSCYAFAGDGDHGEIYLYANDVQGVQIYNGRLAETSMLFRQPNDTLYNVKLGLRALSGNSFKWMGMGYAHLYKVYDLETDPNLKRVTDISISIPLTTIEKGASANATANISPSDASIKEVKWSSSDPFIFNVDKTGKIVAYSTGTARLIAAAKDGSNKKAEVEITVIDKQTEDSLVWYDMSFVITNPTFDIDGNSDGWTISREEGTSTVRSGCLEFWNIKHFKTSQLIENLERGHYRLWVQAYYRNGSYKNDYNNFIEGELTSDAYMFVNEQKQTLVPFCSYHERTKLNDGWISPDNGLHWLPNTMETASEAFAKEAYWNCLEFDVEEEQKNVTIGIALDEYSPDNWCIFTNFKLETDVEIDMGKTYTLNVLDETGNNLSNMVTILWQDSIGNNIGSGPSIGGIKKSAELYYSVILGEPLGLKYLEVNHQRANLEVETITCQLQRIEEVTLHGKVEAYGTALPRVEVYLTQWLNGKYEYTAKTLTEANGEFTMNAYNDSTELIIVANGYFDNKIVRHNFNNGGELGTIDMQEVQGKVLALNISYQEATKEGVEPIIQNWYSDTRNLDYTVINLTKGREITDYGVQQGNIVMPTGTERGDKIQITVRSLNDKFSEVTAEGIIADNDTAKISLFLVAYGGIDVKYEAMSDDNLLAILYDKDGKLTLRTICSSKRLCITNLTKGNYSLVTMGYNGAIGSIASLSDYSEMGLIESEDYIRNNFTVQDGVLTSFVVPRVPELDASKFEYTGLNTSYMPNKTQLVAGNFITLTARLDFKQQYAGKTDNAKVIVDIPEGCEFVPNSVVVGAKPIPHSLNGNRLTITVDEDNLDSRIRFCVIPTQTGTYMTSAYAEFDYKGTKTQPMGQIRFESTSGELYVPSTTRTSTITIGGIGVPRADVEVYDNDNYIGFTKTLANGKWQLKCLLHEAYNLSTHNLYVKYRGESGFVGKTDTKVCFYDKNAVVIENVTMLNTAHPAGNLTPTQYSSVFDFINQTAHPNYYSYWPEYPDFTFLINFSQNDTCLVSNVNLNVYTIDGDVRILPAEFNHEKHCFIAAGSFDSYSLPVSVVVNYTSNTILQGDHSIIEDKMAAKANALENQKKELMAFDESFNELNSIDTEKSLYDIILEALENGDYSNATLKNYIEMIEKKYPNDDIIIDNVLLSNEFEQQQEEIRNLMLKYSKDSIYASFGINSHLLNAEIPTPPYSDDYVFGNQTTLYQMEQLSSINEEDLIAKGYVKVETTSDFPVFCLMTDSEISFIDCNTLIKYSSITSEVKASSRRKAKSDMWAVISTTPFSPSLLQLANQISELSNFDKDNLIARRNALNLIINLVDDLYNNMFRWTQNKLITSYSTFNADIDAAINIQKASMEYYDRSFNKLLSQTVWPSSPTSEEVKELSKLMSMCQKAQKNIEKLEQRKISVKNVYNVIQEHFTKLPKNPKIPKSLQTGGKLLGGFGVFLELCGLYEDVVNARDTYNTWIVLMNKMEQKIPCPLNSGAAASLQNAIKSNARDLSHNIDRVLNAEMDAIVIDCVSFATEIGGLATGPGAIIAEGAGIAIGFVSNFINIYAEWSKLLSINGKFNNLYYSYRSSIDQLRCFPFPNDGGGGDDGGDGDNGGNGNGGSGGSSTIIPKEDPSGYVYEAVPTNRVKEVKATIYYGDEDLPIQWDAEDYGEINPQITKEDGLYAWDVPQGMWKVIFEKEGYETAQTDWLPVPPPQLEINIPMSHAVAPQVENALGAESGITLSFSKYMKPKTLTKSGRVSVTCNGKSVKGDVELLNLEENPFNKEEYASKIKFVPNTAFTTSDEVIITVKKEVESYAGKQMDEDFVQRVKIESEIKELACDSVIALDYQNTGTLELSVLPAAAAKGRTVQVASTSPMIASVDTQYVTLNDEGKARILITGELPGNASLHLSMPEAGVEKYVAVNVVMQEKEVKMPKASKLSGSTFEEGYMLTLTCATKGATIYYTLDGSCPCDEQTRRKYTGPITLPEGQVTLRAIAVREGMIDSEVAEYNYTITKNEPDGVWVLEENSDFETSYQDGSIVVTGAKGASCHVYDMLGRELACRRSLSSNSVINVPKSDVYIVSVLFSNGQTVVHKIKTR